MQLRQSFKFTEAQRVEVEVSVLAEVVWSVVNQWAPTASMFSCSFDSLYLFSSYYICTGKGRGQKAVEWLMITPCPYTRTVLCYSNYNKIYVGHTIPHKCSVVHSLADTTLHSPLCGMHYQMDIYLGGVNVR